MRACVFLDRDGVINEKATEGDYVRSWDDFRIIPTIVDWIRLFNVLGYLVIVVTNQRGVARGLVAPDELATIHRLMVERLAEAGATVDDVFCCPHHADACDCRKPKPGLVEAACRKWNVDLSRSLLIGDSEADRQLAAACGLPLVFVRDGRIVAVARKAGAPASAS